MPGNGGFHTLEPSSGHRAGTWIWHEKCQLRASIFSLKYGGSEPPASPVVVRTPQVPAWKALSTQRPRAARPAAGTGPPTAVTSCRQNRMREETGKHCQPHGSTASTSSSSSLLFFRYARSCQDPWPEPRVYDDVPYEKMQVRLPGASGTRPGRPSARPPPPPPPRRVPSSASETPVSLHQQPDGSGEGPSDGRPRLKRRTPWCRRRAGRGRGPWAGGQGRASWDALLL